MTENKWMDFSFIYIAPIHNSFLKMLYWSKKRISCLGGLSHCCPSGAPVVNFINLEAAETD